MNSVEIEINNSLSIIKGALPDICAHQIAFGLSYLVPGSEFSQAFKRHYWDGRKHLYTNKDQSFPTGLLSLVRKILIQNNIIYTVRDMRPKPASCLSFSFNPPVVLRPYQEDAVRVALTKQRGIVRAATGCHARDTEILMYDGSIKLVQDVQVGDKLIGPDSQPRQVLTLHKGKQEMIKIIPTKGEPFVVNMDHILSLQRTHIGQYLYHGGIRKKAPSHYLTNPIEDISVRDYLAETKTYKHRHMLYKVPIEFKTSNLDLHLDPYLLGVWLGDGSSNGVAVTTEDIEIEQAWINYGKQFGLGVRNDLYKGRACKTIHLTNGRGARNPVLDLLNWYGLIKNKHIPQDYLVSSREIRLAMLAGLLDTDGWMGRGYFEISTKFPQLNRDILFLARSLGFAAYSRVIQRKAQTGPKRSYHCIHILGDISVIPTKLHRKQAAPRLQIKNVLRTGFKVQVLPPDWYYGFELDEDHRYLTGDFIVHHNSGKTLIISGVIGNLKVPTLVLIHKRDIFYQLIDTLEKSLNTSIGRLGDGHVDIQPVTVAMIQTAAKLFDSKSKKTKHEDKDDTYIDDPDSVAKYLKSVKCICADEGHHLPGSQYDTVLRNCDQAFYRYCFSATPFRSDNSDLLIEAHTGPKFVDISASELIQQGYLTPPTIYLALFKHPKIPSELTYKELYDQEVVDNAARNEYIVNIAQLAVKAGKTVLVAVTKIKHGEILQEMLRKIEPSTVFVQGSVDSQVRRQILKDLDAKKVKIAISTTCFGEGVDVPSLDVLINAKAADSSIDSLQLTGRVLRKTEDKTQAFVVDIMDHGCRFLGPHSDSRLTTYQTEPLYKIVEMTKLEDLQF